MSTKKPKTTITTLHEELVIQILSSLAVKDIIRCKCVCKSWCSLIMSPSFIGEQLKVSNSRHPDLLIKYVNRGLEFPMCKHPRIDLVSHETLEVVDTQIVLSNTSGIDMTLATKNTILGSCNGVVCLYHDAHDAMKVILWNPATRDAKLLPPPLYRCHPEKSATYYLVAIGYGFDANNDDYKVILIQKTNYSPRRFGVEVYSLKSNGWRLLSDDKNLHIPADVDIVGCCAVGVSTKGMLSWLASRKDGFDKSYEVVVSFDIRDEVFIQTPCPRFIVDHPLRTSLVAHNGSVTLTWKTERRRSYDEEYYVWVLGQYGVEESWTRLDIKRVDAMYAVPLGVGIWNNRMVFSVENEETETELHLIEPNPRAERRLERTQRVHYYPCSNVLQVFLFNETLVPIKRR